MYNIRVKVIGKYGKCIDAIYVDADDAIVGIHIPERRVGILRPISHENGIKNTENAPKYDPNRLFRKGDIVRLREYNGRKPYDFWHKQVIKNYGAELDTVLEDELDSGNVDIFQDAPIDELTVRVHSCHLELVTPVEELEPYSVKLSESGECGCFEVMRGNKCVSIYPYGTHETRYYKKASEAKEAAEAECKRLNDEYRKEQSND